VKHDIVRTIAFATLSLGLTVAASAQEDHTCSLRAVAGAWGYSVQGTFLLPTTAVPIAFVGRFTVDAAGNFSGAQTSNASGNVSHDVLMGTLTVNSDCTGTFTVDIYDPSGNLLRSAVWALVLLDDAREVRGTFESLTLSNGMNVPAIAVVNAKRLFRNQGQEQ
jgi:hypothetical protein